MKTKHTPGEWFERNETIWNEDMTLAIAVIDSFNGSDVENKANAKLIAAAPDLLEALQKYVEEVESRGNESDWAFNTTYVNAMKAIKKATE